MLKAVSFAALCLVGTLAQATVYMVGTVTVDSMVQTDSAGHPLPLAIVPNQIFSNVQTAGILYGADAYNYSTSKTRSLLTDICATSLVIPGANMGSSACATGPTGVWTASAWANTAPAAVSAGLSTHWYITLQPGESLSLSATVSVFASSSLGLAPPDSPVSQSAYVEAHFFFTPPFATTVGTQLTASAGSFVASASDSTDFSYQTTNTYSFPVDVYVEVVISPTGTNAITAIPEPAPWQCLLLTMPLLAWRLRAPHRRANAKS